MIEVKKKHCQFLDFFIFYKFIKQTYIRKITQTIKQTY